MENIYIVEKLYIEENKKTGENARKRTIIHKYFNNITDLSEYIQKDINEEHIKYFEILENDNDKLRYLLRNEAISLEEYLERSGEYTWIIKHPNKELVKKSNPNGDPFLWKRILFNRPYLDNPMVIDYVVHEIPYGGH